MKMKFTEPKINIEMFMTENIVTTSGTGSNTTGTKIEGSTDGYDVKSISWKNMFS